MNKLPTLEQRIAAALTSTDITSSDLATLIVEVEAAAQAAAENAIKTREEALDPAIVVDVAKVGAAVATASSLVTDYKPHCQDCRSGSSRYANEKTSQRGKPRPKS